MIDKNVIFRALDNLNGYGHGGYYCKDIDSWSHYSSWVYFSSLNEDVNICTICLAEEINNVLLGNLLQEDDYKSMCSVCGNELELVRPGKYQCNYCEGKVDVIGKNK